MEEPGQKLKRARERLNLRYRDVEEASQKIADRHKNDEFIIALSRLADIENKGTVPSIYRLYALCAIYRLDLSEALEWYGIKLSGLASDSASIEIEKSHLVNFGPTMQGELTLPLALDPGIDLQRTTYLSRHIQRWGKVPLLLLDSLEIKEHRYGFIGTDDWSMFPILMPGSLVQIDESKKSIVESGWTHEFERPIYFLEHRDRYYCSWCTERNGNLILQPHSSSHAPAEVFKFPSEIEVIGQVVAVAMRLDVGKRRHTRF